MKSYDWFSFVSVCNPFVSPSNGSVYLSDNGMTATISCDVGFTLNGNTNSSCLQDGSGWDNTVPVCGMCKGCSKNPRQVIDVIIKDKIASLHGL